MISITKVGEVKWQKANNFLYSINFGNIGWYLDPNARYQPMLVPGVEVPNELKITN